MQTIVVIPDTHVPYHDKKSFNAALAAIKSIGPTGIVIIGDFADFYSVSSHSRDPNRKDHLQDEVRAVNVELDRIEALAGSRVAFVEGNHEDRFRRYLWDKAPELYGLATIPQLFNLDKRGWRHRPYRHGIKIGKVTYKHDFAGKAGKYALAQSLEEFGGNLVIGHTHRGGVAYIGEGRPDGDMHFGLNVGWLGDLEQMDYTDPDKVRKDWQHGFGIVDYSSSGLAHAQFVPIIRGQVVGEYS